MADQTASRSTVDLPSVPADQRGLAVAGWSEPVVIDTYLPEPPSRFPAFLDGRVYQGSFGRVYPLPQHERISPDKRPHTWQAVHLENEWVRLVILPELGGRIYVGYDKLTTTSSTATMSSNRPWSGWPGRGCPAVWS